MCLSELPSCILTLSASDFFQLIAGRIAIEAVGMRNISQRIAEFSSCRCAIRRLQTILSVNRGFSPFLVLLCVIVISVIVSFCSYYETDGIIILTLRNLTTLTSLALFLFPFFFSWSVFDSFRLKLCIPSNMAK